MPTGASGKEERRPRRWSGPKGAVLHEPGVMLVGGRRGRGAAGACAGGQAPLSGEGRGGRGWELLPRLLLNRLQLQISLVQK